VARIWPTERALLPLWARVLIAVLLVATGTAIGMVAGGSDPSAATGNSAADSSPGSTMAARNATLGPVGGPPPSCMQHSPDTTPEICVSQPYGDGDTVYIIHGTGFKPFETVTVELAGVGISPDHPVADLQGTFNYAIDQGHRFFHGKIPSGTYRVVAAESGGQSASASFRVNQAAEGGPPGPPPGQFGPPPG